MSNIVKEQIVLIFYVTADKSYSGLTTRFMNDFNNEYRKEIRSYSEIYGRPIH